MIDLRAIYANCFTLAKPKNATGTIRKYKAEVTETLVFDYALLLPKKYKPNTPMRTLIVLPGTKSADDDSSWEAGDRYLPTIWPKKCAALATTIFHVPQLPEGLDFDATPDYSREGQAEREQQRIASVFGTYAETMSTVNVDRPRLFLDCARGNSAFGIRFVSMFPDRFAGIILRHPTELEDLRLGSLSGMPVLLLKSGDNGEVIDTLKKQLETRVAGRGHRARHHGRLPVPRRQRGDLAVDGPAEAQHDAGARADRAEPRPLQPRLLGPHRAHEPRAGHGDGSAPAPRGHRGPRRQPHRRQGAGCRDVLPDAQ